MSFSRRTKVASIIVDEMNKNYWNPLANKYSMAHTSFGYETHISTAAQALLKGDFSTTAKHIRFAPDSVLVAKFNNGIKSVLLEYKVTRTPRFSLKDKQWSFGQIEADAWENYLNLINAFVDVAIVIYCPYHPRPLLCDYPNSNWVINGRQQTSYSRGSGTDYVNINLNLMRDFDSFMEQEFRISSVETQKLLSADVYQRWKTNPNLTIEHDFRSYFQYETGFNWLRRYKNE